MKPRRLMRQVYLLLPALLFLAGDDVALAAPNSPSSAISWQPWSNSAFAQAKREHKFVLLDLQAVWCHWCHVMDVKTYSNPQVIALMNAHYIAVRVDQDSRPDLASRYQDYGWPATVVFNADGGEIVKRQGYLPPEQMASILQAIIDDPTPGPSVVNGQPLAIENSSTTIDAESLKKQLWDGYDAKLGGWGTVQKFLNWDNVEYCLVTAQSGDTQAEKAARQTLEAQRKLIDPVWGGVDQYSAGDDWDHPHFEKIMQFQAENLRIYAEAYAQWKEPAYLQAAEGIHRYVRDFLTSPDGVVYTSQDADLAPGEHAASYFALNDAERRKLGIPRIDHHIYSRENGWFIEALTTMAAATGNRQYADEATRAASWILRNRALPGGGFRHGGEISGPISLGDTLAMGRAFLGLYQVTADRAWLMHAEENLLFIDTHFPYRVSGTVVGYASSAVESGNPHTPLPDFDENVSLARFANLLFHYTGTPRDHDVADAALRFAGAPNIAKSRFSSVGALLLALQELTINPLHLSIVGRKNDPTAQKLFAAALAFPVIYKQLQWIDPSEKATTPGADIYPDLPMAAAYICANQSCSSPAFDAPQLVMLLQRMTTRR